MRTNNLLATFIMTVCMIGIVDTIEDNWIGIEISRNNKPEIIYFDTTNTGCTFKEGQEIKVEVDNSGIAVSCPISNLEKILNENR